MWLGGWAVGVVLTLTAWPWSAVSSSDSGASLSHPTILGHSPELADTPQCICVGVFPVRGAVLRWAGWVYCGGEVNKSCPPERMKPNFLPCIFSMLNRVMGRSVCPLLPRLNFQTLGQVVESLTSTLTISTTLCRRYV